MKMKLYNRKVVFLSLMLVVLCLVLGTSGGILSRHNNQDFSVEVIKQDLLIENDTTPPIIEDYDYQQSISADAIKAAEGYDLTIKALQAQDASGIDFDKSYVELRWSLANGGNSSKRWTGSDICNDMIYNIKSVDGNVKDGTYTIVYCVYDKAGNSTTKSYAIAVGDNVKPEVVVDDDFIGTSYTVGSAKVKIDLTKVHATDASGCEAATVTLKNTSTGKTVEMTKISDDVYEISMDEVGSYTLTVEVKDKVGNTTTKTFNYDVVAKLNYDISGVVFEDCEYFYDGTEKKLEISGQLPAGVVVTYTKNNLTNAGELVVTATFYGDYERYNEIAPLTAKLTIKKAKPAYARLNKVYANKGQKLENVKLLDGWQWNKPSEKLDCVGEFEFDVTYTPNDTNNYEIITTKVVVEVKDNSLMQNYAVCGVIGASIIICFECVIYGVWFAVKRYRKIKG